MSPQYLIKAIFGQATAVAEMIGKINPFSLSLARTCYLPGADNPGLPG